MKLMRIKTRIHQLEIANKQSRSKENEVKIGFRVLESGKRTAPFQHTHVGKAYAEYLAFFNLVHLHEVGLIDSLNDVCGKDMLAPTEEAGLFQNSSGEWEMLPEIEFEVIKQFLEEDHRRLGNDPLWIKGLRERLAWLKIQL